MRIYELIYIVKPDLLEDEADAVSEMVKEVIETGGGTIDKIDKWGKRRLAYRVQKYQDGYYTLMQYSAEDAKLPKEIERRLRVADPVIKFMTVRIDEDLKRVAKVQAQREKRTQRKPTLAVANAPGRPTADAPMAPGSPEDGDES
ncbi:MAG: 30S ribosomal protein S6 [Acidobacteria bacterium]|nr:30S ribosomal protein S6 [Acidobacteriota bacterium]